MSNNLTVYVDEKMNNNEGWFFILGVILDDDNLKQISDFVRRFKKELFPNKNEDEWYLKGSGEHIGVDRDDKVQAFRRWVLWSRMIVDIKTPFNIHGAITLNEKLKNRLNNQSILKDANARIQATALSALLLSINIHQVDQLRLVTDNVDGKQLVAYQSAVQHINAATTEAAIKYNIHSPVIVSKDEMNTERAQILQFVDMLVYSMTRFILPTKDHYILADFEKLPYLYSNNEISKIVADYSEESLKAMFDKYATIGSMYHYLRGKIIKNVWLNSIPYSSIFLLGEKTHHNFGKDVDNAIWSFCNTMWPEMNSHSMLIDFNNYD